MDIFDFTHLKCVNFNGTKWIKYIIHELYEELYYEIYRDGEEIEDPWYVEYYYNKHRRFKELGFISELELKSSSVRYKMATYKI